MRWVALGAATAILLLLALDRAFPPDLSRLEAVGTEVVDRNGRSLALLPAPGGVWRFATAVEDVDPGLVDRLVSVEDRHFWSHPGVNPLALLRAGWQAVRAGRVVSGGSTLTMQAARLLQPRPRTLRAKLIEIARALQLEARFSKREILGIWLTLAPYGGNLEGVRAGSLAWFGQSPRLLEPAQAALLVAIPRRPEALRPDRHAARARALRDRILAADGGPMPERRQPLPRHASQALAGLGRDPRIATTLDLDWQSSLEHLAADRLRGLGERVSLAIVVADARRHEFRALVSGGGQGVQEARAGSLDLTRAVRSPGSALKPFIYGMAFQDGLVGPDSRVDDLPRRFGGYAPEDFDRSFAGSVTAGEALRRSLNLPAVALLDRVGPLRFTATLRAAGVALHLPRHADAALPIALGGVGITLRDATMLYAALATDGSASGLRLRQEDAAASRPLLSPRAAASVAGVLTQPLPDRGPGGIAWKTGTSWGGRDAWAMGFDLRHVVGVWVGRPDGTPMAAATGRDLALPLLARVFDLLPPQPRDAQRQAGPAGPAMPGTTPADALRLLFPPPGAVLSGDGQITLRAMGGRRPLTFMVDGAPLPTEPARREAAWLPQAPGFYRVTVLDAEGAAARAAVRVK